MTDKLIDAFLWVWELVYCCLALPIALGLSWLVVGSISEALDKIYPAATSHPFVYGVISIIVGIFLKNFLTKRRKLN